MLERFPFAALTQHIHNIYTALTRHIQNIWNNSHLQPWHSIYTTFGTIPICNLDTAYTQHFEITFPQCCCNFTVPAGLFFHKCLFTWTSITQETVFKTDFFNTQVLPLFIQRDLGNTKFVCRNKQICYKFWNYYICYEF